MKNIEALEVMDAECLGVPDASFDVVVAQYVVTAIPNPERALDEFARVVRPGGEIILTTRVGAETGLRGTVEKWLMPLTTSSDFAPSFPGRAMNSGRDARVPFGYWNGARCRRSVTSGCCAMASWPIKPDPPIRDTVHPPKPHPAMRKET